jgi:ATP-dependent Clp protease, protease subunit
MELESRMWPFGRRRGQESSTPEALLRRRVVVLRGIIRDDVATDVIARLLILQHEDARQPLSLRIESPGGTFAAGMAIVDTVRSFAPPVRTEAPALAHGIAAVILAAGRKGERVVGPAAKLSLVPIWSPGPATSTAELDRTRHELTGVIAELSGQPTGVVTRDLLVGRHFTPDEAVVYGLADRVGVSSDKA